MLPAEIYYYRDCMEPDFPFQMGMRDAGTLNQVPHAHENFQICYITKGTCLHHIQDQAIRIVKGDMFAIPPFLPHRLEPCSGKQVELIQIDFMPMLVEPESGELVQMFFPKIPISLESQLVIERLIEHMKLEHTSRNPGYQMLIKADLLRLLVTLFREHSASEPDARDQNRRLMHETMRYIEAHYAEPLSLEEMASRAAMSPAYFSYMFKIMKGQNFIPFVNRLRIAKAAQLLRHSQLSVTEICYSTGFRNASHFNRMFKKSAGVTPTEYRSGEAATETESESATEAETES